MIEVIVFGRLESLFRIQAQNLLTAESCHTRIRDGILMKHRSKLVLDCLFREAFESQKKDNTALLHFVHSDDMQYRHSFRRVFNLSFKDLLFQFLSFAEKVRLLE
jgi:hypothetical protein